MTDFFLTRHILGCADSGDSSTFRRKKKSRWDVTRFCASRNLRGVERGEISKGKRQKGRATRKFSRSVVIQLRPIPSLITNWLEHTEFETFDTLEMLEHFLSRKIERDQIHIPSSFISYGVKTPSDDWLQKKNKKMVKFCLLLIHSRWLNVSLRAIRTVAKLNYSLEVVHFLHSIN